MHEEGIKYDCDTCDYRACRLEFTKECYLSTMIYIYVGVANVISKGKHNLFGHIIFKVFINQCNKYVMDVTLFLKLDISGENIR